MPRNESGQYVKPPGTTAIPNTTIASAPYNALQDDMADALTESLPRTGVAPMLADLPMNGKKITGLDDGTNPGDAVNKSQLDGVDDAKLNKDGSNATSAAKWALVPIGARLFFQTNEPGIELPPDNAGFIVLSAGEDGPGDYNEGKVTGETITGSGATLSAVFTIDDPDSPMDGVSVRCINTEERVIYAGTDAKTGQSFNDQMQQITGVIENISIRGSGSPTGAFTLSTAANSGGAGAGDSVVKINFDSADSPNARTGDRTRAKGIFMVAYLKYKDVG